MADLDVVTADEQRQHGKHHQAATSRTVLYASLAGVAVGGPLLGMTGFTFIALLTLLLITSPLLIIFSALLFCAGVVLVTAITGCAASVAMAVAGVSTLAWIFNSSFRSRESSSTSPPLVEFLGSTSTGGTGGVTTEKYLVESDEKVKEQGKDWAGYLQQKKATQNNPSENNAFLLSPREVLVVKRRVDQVNEDLEEKESRKVEEKHEDKLCIKVVRLERKIKHYISSQKILLVGEGDFSFSASLAMVFGSASNMVATSLDSKEFLHTNYKKAKSNICELRRRGCKVMHGMDATKMANNSSLNALKFDRIIYNFPHAGFFTKESRESQLKRHTTLVLKFLDNAVKLIPENGEIHITHKSCSFFLEWNLELLASNVGLRLIEEVPFNLLDYEGYNTKYGFGGDKNFNCQPSRTYKFGLKMLKHSYKEY